MPQDRPDRHRRLRLECMVLVSLAMLAVAGTACGAGEEAAPASRATPLRLPAASTTAPTTTSSPSSGTPAGLDRDVEQALDAVGASLEAVEEQLAGIESDIRTGEE